VSARAIALATAALAFPIACSGAPSRGSADFERMRQQQRYDPYEASRYFSDGMASRTPPSGTVAYEEGAASSAFATGREHGIPVRQVPAPVTAELLASGARQFAIHCAVCHGADGSGRSLMAENMYGSRPPSLLTPAVAAQPAGALFELISAGKNRMPSFAWALPPADRWAVVAYVRTLSSAQTPAAAAGGATR
jgi:mono/diheme cytochrome c family protein